ncbi:Ail/Lom family outer membrane beta-barrel protein [Serratia sp. NPDC078593]|uniref:Ail/Lom family outer membrane beta-barrel protein n=1 Tax=unclassified Serratia (in: enterobacteria) TaxID=2647522 RepID=UPI0037D305AA
MMMKTAMLAGTLLAASCCMATAQAESHTVILDYAHTQLNNFNDLDGVNIKYRYEWGSSISVVNSFTALHGDNNNARGDKTEIQYYSYTVGPAYYVSRYLVLYGLVGLSHSNVKNSAAWVADHSSGAAGGSRGESSGSHFAYGAGMLFTPTENLMVDVGYEGSKIDIGGKERDVNAFTVGVGYRF